MRINMLESLSDNIVIDKDKCTFCGICVDRCVMDNLRMKLAPCRKACPLGANCQGYVQLIGRGEAVEGLRLLRETLPFPGILGRVCSQPCEAACHRKQTEDEAVSIRGLKRYLVEQEAEAAVPEPGPETGKRVAIVGSGPAGLMAAHDLRLRGHQVSVYDADSAPGGALRWAIPEFRLPLRVLEEEIGLVERMGVTFRCGVSVGRDKSLAELEAEYDALIVATGCGRHGRLDVEGEDAVGVYHGLPFLRAVRGGSPPAVGKVVVVIGGGNVAVDAAQTALRLGAERVTLVSLESDEDLPAFAWAVDSAVAEGVKLECSWGNPAFNHQDGKLIGVEFQRCVQVLDTCGVFEPRFDDCELKALDADTAIVAIGQRVDTEPFDGSGIVASGVLAADALTLQTAREKVFVAGDASRGPSTVVEAMAGGRRAAESVDRFLKGEHLRYGRSYPGPVETEFAIDTRRGSEDRRVPMAQHRFSGKGDFEEIERGYDAVGAEKEARRCYCCGEPFGKYRTCWFCLPCEVDCPHEALWVDIPYLLR